MNISREEKRIILQALAVYIDKYDVPGYGCYQSDVTETKKLLGKLNKHRYGNP